MLKNLRMPFILIIVLLAGFLGQDFIPIYIQSILYSVSLTFKEALLFLLPFLIFSFLFNSIMQLKAQAIRVLLILLPLVSLSNFTTAWIAYFSGNALKRSFCEICMTQQDIAPLAPSWSLKLTPLISNDYAFLLAALIGFTTLFMAPKKGEAVGKKVTAGILFFLNRLFTPLIPLFILGFVFKLAHDQLLLPLLKSYCFVIVGIFSLAFSYLFLLYLALYPKPLQALRNIFSPMFIGFCTMSSAAALPSMLMATEVNTNRPNLVRAILPPITNFHLVGDCVAIPLLAFGILCSFNITFPDFSTYLLFSFYFVLAKFAVAAVPGGGILVMLPILEAQLGFTGEMLSLITTLYVMLDSFITPANIMGNGAFSMGYIRFYDKFFQKTEGI